MRAGFVIGGIPSLGHSGSTLASWTIVETLLGAGQFVMTLDSSVMNVSIATVAKDVGTTIAGIQTAITLYTLVMAMLMITGGKIGSGVVISTPASRSRSIEERDEPLRRNCR